jgi:hypothetical protein
LYRLFNVHYLSLYKLKIKSIEKALIKNVKKNSDDIETRLKELQKNEPEQPRNPKLIIKNITTESIFTYAEHGRLAFGVINTEAVQFFHGYSMQREKYLNTLGTLCLWWDGENMDKNRTGEGIKDLLGRRMTLGLMIQTDLGIDILHNKIIKSQGFTSRILSIMPKSNVGNRKYKETNIYNDKIYKKYEKKIKGILTKLLPLKQDKAGNTLPELDPKIIRLEPKAKNLWIDFYNETDSKMKREYSDIIEFAGKAGEHCLRNSGNIALWDNIDCSAVNEKQMAKAITKTQCYLNEALRIANYYRPAEDLKNAKKLFMFIKNWVKKHNVEGIAFSEIYQNSSFRPAKKARAVLEILIDSNYIEPVSTVTQIFKKNPTDKDVYKITEEAKDVGL